MQYKKNRPGNFIAEDGKRLERAVFDPDEPLDDTAQTFWTDAMKRMKALELGDSNPYDFDFLNSGMIVGTPSQLMHLFDTIQSELNEDDQALITEYWLAHPKKLTLDYNQVLFSNAHAWDNFDGLQGCFYSWDTGTQQFTHSITGTTPSFIQTPAKYFTCYYELLRIQKSGK